MSEFTVELALMANGISLGREQFTLFLPVEAEKEGAVYFLQEAIVHLKQELLYAQYTGAIPVPEDLWPRAESGKRTFTGHDMFTGRYEDVMNTVELWRLGFNLILAVRAWLARAKAFSEVWQSMGSSDERLRAVVHDEKMDRFNLAVYGISKLRDLCVRIISESLGNAIFKVDYYKEDWEENINVGKLHEALGKREEHEKLRTMRDEDFNELKNVTARLTRKHDETTKVFLGYRNKLTHGNPASVDDSKYYHQLEDRKWEPIPAVEAGKPTGRTKGVGVGLGRPEWTSESLHSCLVQALDHYIVTLRMLKAIPGFGG
jgi:hypothetical protein